MERVIFFGLPLLSRFFLKKHVIFHLHHPLLEFSLKIHFNANVLFFFVYFTRIKLLPLIPWCGVVAAVIATLNLAVAAVIPATPHGGCDVVQPKVAIE